MKKNNLVTGIIYIIIGIICLAAALLTDSKLDSLLFGFTGAGIVPGIMMISKYFYWNSPNNIERYKENVESQNIELHDELKEKIRCKTAQYVYVLGLCVISVSIIVFAFLNSLEILENGNIFVLYLCAYMAFQIVSGHIIFNKIFKKYQ